MNGKDHPTAALLIIGNEILSGRTQDVNLNAVAKKLASIGIPLKEVRVVLDQEDEIVAALNALRSRFTYVFTTGGIGPTHDDITVDAVAAAFKVDVVEHPEARAILTAHYGAEKLTAARLRMARVPEGGTLVGNPVSAAPGIKMDNVYVLAGVPSIMQAMLEGILPTLRQGPRLYSLTVSCFVAESLIAEALGAIASRFPQLDIGSYPWAREGKFGTSLVTRGADQVAAQQASDEILALVRKTDPKAILSAE